MRRITGSFYNSLLRGRQQVPDPLAGCAFSLGVLAILLQRSKTSRLAMVFDIVAIGTSIFISLAMLLWSDMNGLIQRIMFSVSYLWYANEALTIIRDRQAETYRVGSEC